MAPVQESFQVRDCFESGFYEYDARLVVMDLTSAQRFLNRGPAVRWIELKLADLFATEAMRRDVLAALQPYGVAQLVDDAARVQSGIERILPGTLREDPESVVDLVRAVGPVQRAIEYGSYQGLDQRYRTIDWKEMNQNLFSALRTQKVVLALFFLIIVVVAAFNIVGTQLIVARERVREVSTLVAVGASRFQLLRMFVAHGFTLGCLGVGVGLGLGWLVVEAIKSVDFKLDPKVYLIPKLPAVLHWGDALLIAGLSVLVVLLSCILSSWRATRLNPVDGLRKVV
jgi:ABC-type lipoprotein release transport system permease subunit